MNINNGKTGIIDIPGALHSTGGDGDGQIGGVVAYTGDIWDETQGKNQAEINATINNISDLPLTSINGHVGSFKNIPKEDSNVVEADETIALGVGVYGDKRRSFGWGSGYQLIFLTGSNSQYTLRMNGNSSAKQPFVALATAWVGGYILTSGTTHRRVAKVTAGNFSNGVLTITTNTDLGTLNDAKYCYESKTGEQNFCVGAFINSGRQNIAIGTSNFVDSDFSTTMGIMNGSTKNAEYSNTIGRNNNNGANSGNIIGCENTLKTDESSILGVENSITSNSNTPSFVVGYHNNIPSGYGALIGNDNTSSGDKGYALGEHNNLQYSGVALGHYNKDYTSNSDSEKNLFVVGNGTADNARSNSIEQKQDGTLFIKGVGNFDGTNSNVNTTKSLQETLNEKADSATVSAALVDLSDRIDNVGGVTSYNDLTDKPTILDNYDVADIVKEKSLLQYDGNNYKFAIDNGNNNWSSVYSPNTIETSSNSMVLANYSGLYNANYGVILGFHNTVHGNKKGSNYDSTVTIGNKNTNDNNNSVVIGDWNTNDKKHSTVIGSTNINHSENGVSIGYYNQNHSTTEHNISIGNDNHIFHNIDGIVIGDYNLIAQNNDTQNGQKIIAIGKGLEASSDSIILGFYNATYNGGTLMPKFAVANGTNGYNNGSNLLEQFDNGDLYIKGLGGFNGYNSQYDPRVKSLNTIVSELQTKSTNNDTIINNHFTDNNSIKIGTAINVSGTDSIAGGAGVSLTGNRAFGYGTSMGAIYLTGDEGTYSARLYSTSNYANQNNIADAFATTHLNSYLLNTSDFSRVAQITAITYNGADQPLTITLDTDLGNLSNAVYAIENVAGTKSFNGGSFGNTGQNSSVIGQNNFNTGNSSNILGSVNANTAGTATVLGYLNKNNGSNSNILGSLNDNSGTYGNVIGLQNTNSGQYANIVGRNNNNKCASTNILGIANIVNETTYPSSILGFENNADATTQQFTLGYQNHGTRGQYAQGNVSASFMFGHNLTTSSGCWALGKYNKDYDVQDITKQNFFVVGQGNSTRTLNNLEVKNNGNWYVYGVGGFDGTNSDNANIKTLQTVISELQNTITSLQSRVTALENQLNGGNT